VELIDVNGDNRNDILVATGGEGDQPGHIMALDANENVLWAFNTYEDKYGSRGDRFVVIDFQAADLFHTGENKIVFTARDLTWFPSRMGVLSLDGKLEASYSHPGFVRQFTIGNFDHDGDLEILASAENNNLKAVFEEESGKNYQVVFLLDSRNIEGEAFPPTIDGLSSGNELWYAFLFPLGTQLNYVQTVDRDGDGILDAELSVGDGIIYYVNYNGELINRGISDAWRSKHPNESSRVQVAMIRKDESGKWEAVPIPGWTDE